MRILSLAASAWLFSAAARATTVPVAPINSTTVEQAKIAADARFYVGKYLNARRMDIFDPIAAWKLSTEAQELALTKQSDAMNQQVPAAEPTTFGAFNRQINILMEQLAAGQLFTRIIDIAVRMQLFNNIGNMVRLCNDPNYLASLGLYLDTIIKEQGDTNPDAMYARLSLEWLFANCAELQQPLESIEHAGPRYAAHNAQAAADFMNRVVWGMIKLVADAIIPAAEQEQNRNPRLRG